MNKCWFVLEQSFFTPPEYANPARAGGKAEGPLRLGDVVPSPKRLYPVLTQGSLPLFPPEMRITETKVCDFSWKATAGHEIETKIGAGAPIAAPIGITASAELSTTFKRTVQNWAEFETMHTEIVQPSKAFINGVLTKEGVVDYIDQHKAPLLDRWTIYMVTGLMIGRTGGNNGSLVSKTTAFDIGPDIDIPGVANAKLTSSFSNSNEMTRSGQIQGDRIWAVRLAKIQKGLLRPRWTQTEANIGAALTGRGEEDEQVGEVLQHEGIEAFELTEAETDRGNFVFVTGVGEKQG